MNPMFGLSTSSEILHNLRPSGDLKPCLHDEATIPFYDAVMAGDTAEMERRMKLAREFTDGSCISFRTNATGGATAGIVGSIGKKP